MCLTFYFSQSANVYVPRDAIVTGNCDGENSVTMSLKWKAFVLSWSFAKVLKYISYIWEEIDVGKTVKWRNNFIFVLVICFRHRVAKDGTSTNLNWSTIPAINTLSTSISQVSSKVLSLKTFSRILFFAFKISAIYFLKVFFYRWIQIWGQHFLFLKIRILRFGKIFLNLAKWKKLRNFSLW